MQKWDDSILRNVSYFISSKINSKEKNMHRLTSKNRSQNTLEDIFVEERAVLHTVG